MKTLEEIKQMMAVGDTAQADAALTETETSCTTKDGVDAEEAYAAFVAANPDHPIVKRMQGDDIHAYRWRGQYFTLDGINQSDDRPNDTTKADVEVKKQTVAKFGMKRLLFNFWLLGLSVAGFILGWFINFSWVWLAVVVVGIIFVVPIFMVFLGRIDVIPPGLTDPQVMEYIILWLMLTDVGMVVAVVLKKFVFTC